MLQPRRRGPAAWVARALEWDSVQQRVFVDDVLGEFAVNVRPAAGRHPLRRAGHGLGARARARGRRSARHRARPRAPRRVSPGSPARLGIRVDAQRMCGALRQVAFHSRRESLRRAAVQWRGPSEFQPARLCSVGRWGRRNGDRRWIRRSLRRPERHATQRNATQRCHTHGHNPNPRQLRRRACTGRSFDV